MLGRLKATAAGLAVAAALAGGASAGNLTVAPTRIDLAGGRSAGVLTLMNNASTPVTVQVQTFAWNSSTDLADLQPTRELLAVPPVLQIPPGEKRPIRVALRAAPPGDREESYRLIVTEVPQRVRGGGVQFALRLSLPVFATPKGAGPEAFWMLRRAGKAQVLQVQNAGNAHLQVTRIRLLGADGKELQTIDKSAYVLAGQHQAWPVALPAKALGAGLSVAAETSAGELLAPLPVQGG
jgi:fimbrial chaperone protein